MNGPFKNSSVHNLISCCQRRTYFFKKYVYILFLAYGWVGIRSKNFRIYKLDILKSNKTFIKKLILGRLVKIRTFVMFHSNINLLISGFEGLYFQEP